MAVEVEDATNVSLADVIRETVDEFLAGATGPFDKRQVELKILGTPEFRRVHDVQVQYLHDIDIEAPIIAFMRGSIRHLLHEVRGPNGERLLEAVPAKGKGGRHTWYPVMKMKAPMLQALIEREENVTTAWAEKVRLHKKLLGALEQSGPETIVGDVYHATLTTDERVFLDGRPAIGAPDPDEDD